MAKPKAALVNAAVAGYLDGWITMTDESKRGLVCRQLVRGLRIGVLRMVAKHSDLACPDLFLATLSELERRKAHGKVSGGSE